MNKPSTSNLRQKIIDVFIALDQKQNAQVLEPKYVKQAAQRRNQLTTFVECTDPQSHPLR